MASTTRLAWHLIAILAAVAAAQNASVASINIFMPTAYQPTIQFAASVIGVCHDKTTYGIRCTSGILASAVTCGPDYPEATITEDPSMYIATQTTSFSSAILTLTETCDLKGTTEASCSATITIAGTKTTVVTSTSSTLVGSWIPEYYMYQIPVTAGVQNLHVTGNACSAASKHVLPVMEGVVIAITVILVLAVL